MKRLSPFGYAFIKAQEVGEHGTPALHVKGDTGDKQQIGYGHDLRNGETYPNGITEAFAELLFTQDIAPIERAVNLVAPLYATQMQFDMLCDFTYECGVSALHELLSHGFSQVPKQLPRWKYARVKGVETVLPGMVTRRQREVSNWNVNSTADIDTVA